MAISAVKLQYLPGTYWYATRLKARFSLLSVMIKQFGLLIFMYGVVFRPGFRQLPSLLAALLFSYLLFISLYEIHYLKNDLLAVNGEKLPTLRIEGDYLKRHPLFIKSRIFWAVIFVLILYAINPEKYLSLTIIPLLALVIGRIHNHLLPEQRAWTFFLLRWCKNNLMVPLAVSKGGLLIYIIIMSVYPVISAIQHGREKNGVFNKRFPNFMEGYIVFFLGLTVFPFSPKFSSACVYYIAYLILWHLIVSGMKYGGMLLCARKGKNFYHIHTNFSHDGEFSLEQITRIFKGKETIYLSDHAEDFDADKFRELEEGCKFYSRDGLTLVPGLEYILKDGNHLFASSLRYFIQPQIYQNTLEYIDELRAHSAFVVWAHPYFSVKKLLFKPGYLKRMAQIAKRVDKVELFNLRSCRTLGHNLRSFLIGIICAAFFRKECIVGVDLHNAQDRPDKFAE